MSSFRRISGYPYENQNGHLINIDTELVLPRVDSTGPTQYFKSFFWIESYQGSALH